MHRYLLAFALSAAIGGTLVWSSRLVAAPADYWHTIFSQECVPLGAMDPTWGTAFPSFAWYESGRLKAGNFSGVAVCPSPDNQYVNGLLMKGYTLYGTKAAGSGNSAQVGIQTCLNSGGGTIAIESCSPIQRTTGSTATTFTLRAAASVRWLTTSWPFFATYMITMPPKSSIHALRISYPYNP